MPTYIEPLAGAGGIMTSYYLLQNIQHFSVHRNGKESSVSANFPSDQRVNSVKLVQNVDEKRAVAAIEELLSLTAGQHDSSVIVIRWDGQHFTRRLVHRAD